MITDLFKKPAAGLKKAYHTVSDKVRQFFREKIPGTKERLILVCGVAAIILLALIGNIITTSNKTRSEKRAAAAAANQERIIIAPDELFLPEEPDFLPGVMLEQERRTSWTADDAMQYWHDPLKSGEEPWREQIEKRIDELMERVP